MTLSLFLSEQKLRFSNTRFKLINCDNITHIFVTKFISFHCPSHVAIQRQQADGKIWTRFIQIITESLNMTDDIPVNTATGDENVCNTAEMINHMTIFSTKSQLHLVTKV